MRGAEVPVRRLPRPVRLLGLVGCCSGAASRGPALPLGCWPPGRDRLPVFLWVRFPCRCRGALAQDCLALGGHRRASRLPVLGSGALLRMGPRDGVRTAHCLPLVAHASPSPVAPDRVLWSTTPGVPPSPGGPVTLVHGTVSLGGRGVAAPPSPGGSATLVHGAVPPSPDGPVTLVLGTVRAPGVGVGLRRGYPFPAPPSPSSLGRLLLSVVLFVPPSPGSPATLVHGTEWVRRLGPGPLAIRWGLFVLVHWSATFDTLLDRVLSPSWFPVWLRSHRLWLLVLILFLWP